MDNSVSFCFFLDDLLFYKDQRSQEGNFYSSSGGSMITK